MKGIDTIDKERVVETFILNLSNADSGSFTWTDDVNFERSSGSKKIRTVEYLLMYMTFTRATSAMNKILEFDKLDAQKHLNTNFGIQMAIISTEDPVFIIVTNTTNATSTTSEVIGTTSIMYTRAINTTAMQTNKKTTLAMQTNKKTTLAMQATKNGDNIYTNSATTRTLMGRSLIVAFVVASIKALC